MVMSMWPRFLAHPVRTVSFSKPVMQHLVNVHCKSYLLLCGADVINWTRSELTSISVAFNAAMCKIYQVKFCLLDDIYKDTGQSDVADTIVSRRRNFLYNVQHSLNVVVGNLATAML